MLPTRIDAQALPPPPGIIGSLRAGFDAITAHIGLILVPLGLDLLLWLGPRLSISKLMQPVLVEMRRLGPSTGVGTSDLNSVLEMYRVLFERSNVLDAIRTLPVGIPSLATFRDLVVMMDAPNSVGKVVPFLSPYGTPPVLQFGSAGQLFLALVLLTLIGWALGGLYFRRVARLVLSRSVNEPALNARRAVAQTILFSLIWAVLAGSIGLPALFIVYITFAINAVLGQGVLLFLGFASLWLLVPLFFSPHGMYVRNQNALASFVGGFQLTRFTLPSSSLFVLAIALVGLGLNLLWTVPVEDSWLAAVGIVGHAFIATALLAASFIYYQDMSVWLQTVLDRLRAGLPAQKA